jgi:hypothetical protein
LLIKYISVFKVIILGYISSIVTDNQVKGTNKNVYENDAIADLDYNKNYVSKELMKRLGLGFEEKENGKKIINKKLLVQMNVDVFLVEFYVNPSDDEWVPSVIFGRPFLVLAKGTVDFAKGIPTRSIISYNIGQITLWAEICLENEQRMPFVIDDPKVKTGRKVSGEYKLSDVMSPGYFRA